MGVDFDLPYCIGAGWHEPSGFREASGGKRASLRSVAARGAGSGAGGAQPGAGEAALRVVEEVRQGEAR